MWHLTLRQHGEDGVKGIDGDTREAKERRSRAWRELIDSTPWPYREETGEYQHYDCSNIQNDVIETRRNLGRSQASATRNR